jgi:hypothetical protein
MRSRKTVGVVCLIAALAILAGYQQSQQPADTNVTMDLSAADAIPAEPMKIEVDQQAAKQPAKAAAKTSAAKPAPARAAKAPATTAATSGRIAADTTPASTPVVESRSVAMKKQDVAMKTQDEEPIATMISGCLEQDNGMFRLKDTDGDHAPKSRSWKSGFIRKGSAKVDVIDATNRFKLATFVGYRVSVSGALVDREIQAQSVRPSSERCD